MTAAVAPGPSRHWRTANGARTHDAILAAAMDLASAHGLSGLTLGKLASELGMSKSGLFAHFGSKEELQLATIESARVSFFGAVVQPAMRAKEGLPRLWALADAWLTYAEAETLRGGCFFSAASVEFDGRPGAVRDRIATTLQEWLDGLASAVLDAKRVGHVVRSADPSQIAFELHALEMGANWAFQLFGDKSATSRARSAIHARLKGIAVAGAPGLPSLGRAKPRALPPK